MNGSFSPTGFKVLRPAIKNLLIINGLFFLATISFTYIYLIDLYDILGLHLIGSEKFHLYQFITYMFMHGGFSHILFNMFALWMFGNVLENYWGSKRFLIYYFVTGIGAAIIYKLWLYYDLKPILDVIDAQLANPNVASFSEFLKSSSFKIVSQDMQNNYNEFVLKYNTAQPEQVVNLIRDFFVQYRIDYMNAPVVVGASGAVFGLLLAFGMLFPNSLIYLYFFIPVKAKYFVIIYGAIELFSGISSPNSNVAHFAHLGGMLFGFILIKLWGKKSYFDNP
jgi:membrane associated rhomboid family serine protease